MRLVDRWRAWRLARRKQAWDRACRRLRIPSDVQARMVKIDPDYRHAPDWYAGRQVER